MNVVQISPGVAGGFYCENCLRDSALAAAVKAAGHRVVMVPMYLPLVADRPAGEADDPVFFGGINVYLQQKFALFRRTPRWIDRIFDSPRLLKWAAGKAGMTSASDLGEATVSMLQGEDGRQAKELRRLTDYLASVEWPDVVCLSNILLVGLAREIKSRLGVPVVSLLQDEDSFLDALPGEYRRRAWQAVVERTAELDMLLPVSRYYSGLMQDRLKLAAARFEVVYPGVNLNGIEPAPSPPAVPTVGFLSPMCPATGLDLLARAFILLKGRPALKGAILRVAGGMTGGNESYVKDVKGILGKGGVLGDAEFLPNLDRVRRLGFLRSLSVLSTPTVQPEALGLFILESLAAGVPVIQPRHGGFTEIIETTGGGVLCEPNNPVSLAAGIERLLLDPSDVRKMGLEGRRRVVESFSDRASAENLVKAFERVSARRH